MTPYDTPMATWTTTSPRILVCRRTWVAMVGWFSAAILAGMEHAQSEAP